MKKLAYYLVLLPIMVIGQTPTQTENYIRTKTYKTQTASTIPSPTSVEANQSVTYFDGLGRPIQQIAYAQTSSSKDIATHIEYDGLARQPREYLPYATTQNTMAFITGSTAKQSIFTQFQTQYGDSIAYSEKRFEASPLNRVLEQAAPGYDWSLSSSSKHTIRYDYLTNTDASGSFAVKLFTATATWNSSGLYDISPTLTGATNYPPNQLYVTVTRDENWKIADIKNNTTEEYKDKEGRVVLKRNFDNGVAHDTYYVYDQFGNLTYVIPPKANGSIGSEVLAGLCYQYKYDSRNRLVEKKLPGKDWEYIVYDKLDRVVATGPALSPFLNLSGTNVVGWMITKYDAFNRPILTGWLSSTTVTSNGRATLQGLYNAMGLPVSETKSLSNQINGKDGFLTRYTNVAIPTAYATMYDVLTVNYYDDYSTNITFTPAIAYSSSVTPQPVYYNDSSGTKPKGLPTVSWVRVPELSTTTPIKAELNYTLYDNKGRVVRTFKNNYLGGYTQVDSQLESITGRLNYKITTHKRLSASVVITVREDFTYTPQDRLITHTHKINSGTAQLLVDNTYNGLGQLISKKVGNTSAAPLQKVDYSYNIRGWLSAINDITNLTDSPRNDLFSFKINYNVVQDETNYDGKELFNGNISETYWKTGSDNVLRKYGYHYDNLNRLKNAIYQKPNASTVVTNSYNENITYDMNGNIMSLQRTGAYDDAVDELTIDNLNYFYPNNNNQLAKVTDVTNSTIGFRDDSDGTNDTVDDYTYDIYGNMTRDDNKFISNIKYNHLNLPLEIVFSNGTNRKINYIYNALGQKVEKKTTDSSVNTTDYIDGFQYLKTNSGAITLQFFPHVEGYVSNTVVSGANTYNYVFNFTDHLGNIRLSYTKDKTALKILEENNYYPFGLKHINYNWDKVYFEEVAAGLIELELIPRLPYQYKYNGKEYQDELGLNMYDYGARNYDPAIGRWMNMDPLAESDRRWSPYRYAYDNPLRFIDPDGMLEDIYGLDKDTGDISLLQKTDDDFDTLVNCSDSTETISSNVDKGLLQDGQNIMKNGLETDNVKGGLQLIYDISMATNDEIGGVIYKNNKEDYLRVFSYDHSKVERNKDGSVTMSAGFSHQLASPFWTSSDKSFSGTASVMFHTHPGHPDFPTLGGPFPSPTDYQIAENNYFNYGANDPKTRDIYRNLNYIVLARDIRTVRGVTSNVGIYNYGGGRRLHDKTVQQLTGK